MASPKIGAALAAAGRRTARLGPRLATPILLAVIARVLSGSGYRLGDSLGPAAAGLAAGCGIAPLMSSAIDRMQAARERFLFGLVSTILTVALVVGYSALAATARASPERWLDTTFLLCLCIWLTAPSVEATR